jgi:hypothetical protein
VHVRAPAGVYERFNDVRRWPSLGIAPAEIYDLVCTGLCGDEDASEERAEILLREPLQALGPRPHRAIVLPSSRVRLGSSRDAI